MLSVSLKTVASAGDIRLDPHHFILRQKVYDLIGGIKDGYHLKSPCVEKMRNGENLPASTYINDDEPSDILYASVGALSQFALRPEGCIPLRLDERFLTAGDIKSSRCGANEILITRSGTPGIAWTPAVERRSEVLASDIIPSGFLIRFHPNPNLVRSGYITAILNHPLWRLWTSSLAAGKRQRNLSQEHLEQVIVPALGLDQQEQIELIYLNALSDIQKILAENSTIINICDGIIQRVCHLTSSAGRASMGTAETVRLLDVAQSDQLRIDHRSLRADLRSVNGYVREQVGVTLAELVDEMIRNSQPQILAVDEGEEPRVIATSSLQHGKIVKGFTKPTRADHPASAQPRMAKAGDLLVAMDGDGSIGKAAVFSGDYDAVCDSHVTILRMKRPSLANAIACFINSSLGQAQIYRNVSGATGQLQLSANDLLSIWIPNRVISNAVKVNDLYLVGIENFSGPTRRVRKRIAEAGSLISSKILKGNCLDGMARQLVEDTCLADELYKYTLMLKPRMF